MKDYGLDREQALWLAFHIGYGTESQHGYNGREGMRAIRSRWDQMGLPVETWPEFEKDILQNDSPVGLRRTDVQFRAMKLLAGECPLGPLDRISS